MVADWKRSAQGRCLNPLPRTLIDRGLSRDNVDLYESNRRGIEYPGSPDPIGLEVGLVECIAPVKVINHAVGGGPIAPVAPIAKLQILHTIHERRGDGRSCPAIHCSRQAGSGGATNTCPGLRLIGDAL